MKWRTKLKRSFIFSLVCCALSAPREGIAVIRRKDYLSDGFCLFDEKVLKVAKVSSSSVYNVEDEHISDCVKQKIISRPNFFYNVFINQYQSRKNNFRSIMYSVIETKKKMSGSSVKLTYRKRNLLWTQKGLQSLKTLKPTSTPPTTTSIPIQKLNLNKKERKKFFSLTKAKPLKRPRVRRYTHRKYSVGKPRNLREQVFFSDPAGQLSKSAWNGYSEKKMQSGRPFPHFHDSLLEFIKNRNDYESSVLKKILQGREPIPEKATLITYNEPKFFRGSPNHASNRHTKSDRSVEDTKFIKKNSPLNYNLNRMDDFLHPRPENRFVRRQKSKRLQPRLDALHINLKTLPSMENFMSSLKQLIYDSNLKSNDELNIENYHDISFTTEPVGSNEWWEGMEESSNNEEEKNNYNGEINRSESRSDTKATALGYLNDKKEFNTNQNGEDFLGEILTATAGYPDEANEDYNKREEDLASFIPSNKKPFLTHTSPKKEIPITDFDFPDYDEIYDATADVYSKRNTPVTPFRFQKKRKFNLRRNDYPKKRHLKTQKELRSRLKDNRPLDLKRSLLLRKMEREKKSCSSKCSKSCEGPHKCWKAAPLLCIPYIRKGQDDLLKYLIHTMQKMMGKPFPQKINVFENIKFKPSVKKPPSNTCEDIIPHEPDDDDDDDNCNSNKCVSTPQPCDPCPSSCPTTPEPCPCPPTSKPCPVSHPPVTTSCPPPSCVENSSKPKCPSLPCTLPNLNRIYTEPSSCSSDKCFSTLPPFLLPPSSIIQSGTQGNLPKVSQKLTSMKPTAGLLSSTSQKNSLISSKPANSYVPITFFPPKKVASKYLSKVKPIHSHSLVDNDKLQSNQQVNDKLLPSFVGCQEEMKILNVTGGTAETESTLITSTINEPFLFELPEFYDDGKPTTTFPTPLITNLLARRNLEDVYDYNNQMFHSKKRHRKKKHHYLPLNTNENDIQGSLFAILPKEESQIDKPSVWRHRPQKFIKHKKRKFLKRHKRADDYDFDNLINYDDYFYDTNSDPETNEKQSLLQLKRKEINSDINNLADDYGWTPLKFEIFSDLAKIVTETDGEASSFTTISASEFSPTELTHELSSSTGNRVETTSTAKSTEKSSVFSKELSTSNVTSSTATRQSEMTSEFKQARVKDETSYSLGSYSTTNSENISKAREETPNDNRTSSIEDNQKPTTLETASIVKGPKKQLTKPYPKIYTKVYPDSVPIDDEKNNTTIRAPTDTTLKYSSLFKTTPVVASVAPNVRLQLLAVCEGYLEVVKLMKSQNQSLGEDLDLDLSRYCESIISQSFSQQTESSKSKTQEPILFKLEKKESPEKTPKSAENLNEESKVYKSLWSDDSVFKRELEEHTQLEPDVFDSTKVERNENTEVSRWQSQQNVKRSKRKKNKYQHGNQKVLEVDDEFLKKGMTKDQVELLRLLKKRKRALLNWLFNSKEGEIQPEVEETEYFDDDDDESRVESLNFRNGSGTVRPRGAKSSKAKSKESAAHTNDSVFPVYAKQYGYDKGGELRQVEVLWRKFNEKTHKNEILKNLSVLALLLTSTISTKTADKNNKVVGLNGYYNEDISETRTKNENKVGYAAEEPQDSNNSSISNTTTDSAKTKSQKDSTVIYISKPDPSSIIGNLNVTNNATSTSKHPNITRKIAGKLDTAKGVVEEYTIEFWNYAVYILPVMFSILFLFCCACCGMHILRNKKRKKKKKKKKKFESTEEEDSTEETDSEPKKKKKRRDKSKNSKRVWNVWKKNSKKSVSDVNDETEPPEKKSFLRFLKSKNGDKAEDPTSSVPYSALPESDETKGDTQSEAAERRELIALLEELKKIEMEHVGEKKEQKSVQVQYMLQDHENSLFKHPKKPKGYAFNSKSFQFHEPGNEEYGFYRDVELNELLPCEYGYYREKHDTLRNCDFRKNEDGRCDRFFKIFQNPGMPNSKHSKVKNFNDDSNFIFDKYRNANVNDKAKEASFTKEVYDMSYNLPARNSNDWVGVVEDFKHQTMKKKHVRLKDDGVLCRL